MIGPAHRSPVRVPEPLVFLIEWALVVLLLVAVEVGGLLVLNLFR